MLFTQPTAFVLRELGIGNNARFLRKKRQQPPVFAMSYDLSARISTCCRKRWQKSGVVADEEIGHFNDLQQCEDEKNAIGNNALFLPNRQLRWQKGSFVAENAGKNPALLPMEVKWHLQPNNQTPCLCLTLFRKQPLRNYQDWRLEAFELRLRCESPRCAPGVGNRDIRFQKRK